MSQAPEPTTTQEPHNAKAIGRQTSRFGQHYGQVLLVGIMLLASIALWRLSWQAAPTPHPPPHRKSVRPCPHWVALSGAWQRPRSHCLHKAAAWRPLLLAAAPRCQLPTHVTTPAHGMRLHIPNATPGAPCQLLVLPMSAAKRVVLRIPFSLNNADAKTLTAIPGMHRSVAKKVIAYRLQHGPFQSIDQLVEVRGIGPKTLAKVRPFLHLGKPLKLPMGRE